MSKTRLSKMSDLENKLDQFLQPTETKSKKYHTHIH